VYLRDVLKRFMLINEPITFNLRTDEKKIITSNNKFSQVIPILSENNMSELGTITFKLSWSILSKAILGKDADHEEELNVYFLPFKKGGYTLILSDNEDKWFSLIQVR
jgi:hypothetical protein